MMRARDVTVVPGISDHEAATSPLYKIPSHKAYLFHKGYLSAIKEDVLKFQESFNLSDPYSKSVNNNWINLQTALLQSIQKHIPQKTCKSRRNLPWVEPWY